MEDKRALLEKPLHGIYIPIFLIIFGTSILNYEYLPYSIAFIVLICSINFYSAYSRRSSLDYTKWNDFELIDKTVISRNSAIYRFKLNNEEEVLDIPTGHHLACCFLIDGKDEIRYYSPISNKFDAGFFDILVKSYPNGTVSRKFAELREGQTVKFRGPVGRLQYKTNMAGEIGLIAGGSGITPLLQVITQIITTSEDNTKITLLFANETLNDILLKGEIDEIARSYPDFNVHYTLTYPPENWEGNTGYVSKEMIEKYMPKPDPKNRLFICGPPLMKKSLIEIASSLGWDKAVMKSEPEDQVFCF
ncbi:uncharacterized protein PRCAT00004466001 [Priceomyces carsonii]|uniref:uncharacterized protein n=1 Tax=Priceomyces carsonii TaxID=28549 RepID=UPI002EDA7E18|nr:unnamed protein product [Priceomyces carsonii]